MKIYQIDQIFRIFVHSIIIMTEINQWMGIIFYHVKNEGLNKLKKHMI